MYYDYRNYADIKDALFTIERQHSSIAKVYDIGDSWEKTQSISDRDILALKVSDKVLSDEDEPEVMIVGLHHAREWPTSETVLEIAENITNAYGNNSRISWLVDNREIWIVPVVNPDGLDYALSTDQWWRKNRRLNFDGTYGVDLNRNYAGSMNGDPAGAWGGVGASHDPSSDIYCGLAPFSEPETQAIRDLVLQHDFEIALDYHTYGELTIWPWGYTTNITSDNDHLVRIGHELAALNGYTAEQSVGMYPTTGDSLDWLYGGAGIFPFLFEIGTEFHPDRENEVLPIIAENISPALLGIEIAGDREERAFTITHNSVPFRNSSVSGFELNATMLAGRGVNASSPVLHYRVDSGSWSMVPMTARINNDTYAGTIPNAAVGSLVDYYVVAYDLGGVYRMAPTYAPYESYSFTVSEETYVGPIEVMFSPPAQMDGSVANDFNAHAHNMTEGSDLIMHMSNSSIPSELDVPMAKVSGDDFACTVPQGMPLGVYDLWLTVEDTGSVLWSSSTTQLSVIDGTAPLLWAHDATQVTQTTLTLSVNSSDFYGIVEVVLTYQEQGGGPSQSVAMVLSSGTVDNGTWSVTITIGGDNPVDYSFEAYDGSQHARLPESGSFVFTPVEIPEMSMVGIIAAAVAVLLAILSRARRP